MNFSDAELVRLLASACMQIDKEKNKQNSKTTSPFSRNKQSIDAPVLPDDKGGLKVGTSHIYNGETSSVVYQRIKILMYTF